MLRKGAVTCEEGNINASVLSEEYVLRLVFLKCLMLYKHFNIERTTREGEAPEVHLETSTSQAENIPLGKLRDFLKIASEVLAEEASVSVVLTVTAPALAFNRIAF